MEVCSDGDNPGPSATKDDADSSPLPPSSDRDEIIASQQQKIDRLQEDMGKLRAANDKLSRQLQSAIREIKLAQTTPPTQQLDTDTDTQVPPDNPKSKRRKLRKPQTPVAPSLPLQNRFAPLEDQTPETSTPQTISPPTTTVLPPPAKPTPPPSLLSIFTATPVLTPATFTTIVPPPEPKDTIPPIVLHDKDSWVRVSAALKTQNSQYSRATNTREGIRIVPATIDDYRRIHTYLSHENLPFHTFQLPSEKTLKVVIRGVPQSLSNEQILADLLLQKYIPLQVNRLNGRNNRPAPLILIQVERKFKSIFNLKTLCGLDVTVEAKRLPSNPLQCHRCQRFGHVQPNCHAPYACLKCAEPHSTHLCTKPTTTPAVCANCNSGHISSHHSCPQNPINLKKSYATALKPSPTQPPPLSHTAYPKPPETTSTPTDNSFANLCFPLFKALLASNPTPERITAFTTQLQLLKQTLLQ